MRFVFGPCFENTILGAFSSFAIISLRKEREREREGTVYFNCVRAVM